jgi:hypothetical protein
MRHELDVAKLINEPPENGHAPHGKIHFSLCPSKDGFLYAATHCSTPPVGDLIWDGHTFIGDQERSFTGSHFLRVHPLTHVAADLGRLFPNEGVGVMALDDPSGRCVGVTYPTGRAFFIDKDGAHLLDCGRYSESYTLSLIRTEGGYVFGTDTFGYFLRINMKERTVEHLSSRVPYPLSGASGLYRAMCDSALGRDGFVYAVCYGIPRVYRFAPTPSGPIQAEEVGQFAATGHAPGIVLGDDGHLYACVNAHLMRLDIRKRKVEDFGLLEIEGAERHYWRCVKGKDGRLYAGECGAHPVSMIIIDPSKL